MKQVMIILIRVYQMLISPLLPANTCRFHPTCSNYSIEAFRKYGFWKGWLLTIKRISKCHPWHEGGYDPVR